MVDEDRLQSDLAQLMREDWGRLLAVLVGDLRDFQLAEDCLSQAFGSAVEHWPRGRPRNPQGWLLQVARRKAISRLRRAATRAKAQPQLEYLMALDAQEIESDHDIPDERLRLIFTACHPALGPKTRIALTLRTLCGLTTPEIARAFLDKEATMAQRLARAKTKIAKAGIPYAVPEPEAWQPRLTSVLTVIYLIFNEGYSANTGEAPIRHGLCAEAIRLARALHSLCPTEPEVAGLLALLLLTHARSPARLDASGAAVALAEHDRSLWDHAQIREGLGLIETALRRDCARPELDVGIGDRQPVHIIGPFQQNWVIDDRASVVADRHILALSLHTFGEIARTQDLRQTPGIRPLELNLPLGADIPLSNAIDGPVIFGFGIAKPCRQQHLIVDRKGSHTFPDDGIIVGRRT